jgi:ABC-type taurine transport system ATPase subunit
LDRVSFRYDQRAAPHDGSVRIEPGQMVAFTGSGGVGKRAQLNPLAPPAAAADRRAAKAGKAKPGAQGRAARGPRDVRAG